MVNRYVFLIPSLFMGRGIILPAMAVLVEIRVSKNNLMSL